MSQNLPNRSLRNFLSSSRHHYLPIPRDPCSSKSRFFSGIQTVYFNCEYYKSASSGFRLLGETPAGAITTGTYFIHTPLRCFFFVCFLLTFHFKYSAKQSLQTAFLGQISGPNQLFKIYRFSNEYNFSSEVYTL